MAKYIFVTGGVVSSVGKGVAVASIGRMLKSRGMSVSIQKLDPYLNVDPGTMSPYQHGEVFVTKDGGETDLDLGHYERFIDEELSQQSNVTAGQIYSRVIAKERKGDYLGGTIQAVPQVTDAIKECIQNLAESSKADVVVVEVGGTVGDIEGLPFLESIRQIRHEFGRENVFAVHVTFLPYLAATGELKTKPTQHSVKELRGIGIQPDAIILRSDYEVPENILAKVSAFCDVSLEGVVPLVTVNNVYAIPLVLEDCGLSSLILKSLSLRTREGDFVEWRKMIDKMDSEKNSITVAVVGKYVDLQDSYISVKEALRHAGLKHDLDINIEWVHSEKIESAGIGSMLEHVSGIVVPGGFGPRGVEGMIETARYARENGVPYLGLCLGMQIMVVEAARSLAGLTGANSTEFDPKTDHPVIDIMPDQKEIDSFGGTMRLGSYPCKLQAGSLALEAYPSSSVAERHRHRFEFNNQYLQLLSDVGLNATGVSPDGRLVEICELADHPFMLGVQFHPEFCSRPDRPHPLFSTFVEVAKSTLREGAQRPLHFER
jgi:CTP synthase